MQTPASIRPVVEIGRVDFPHPRIAIRLVEEIDKFPVVIGREHRAEMLPALIGNKLEPVFLAASGARLIPKFTTRPAAGVVSDWTGLPPRTSANRAVAEGRIR